MIDIVGLENLPNVYITKITFEDNTTESFYLNVELELHDRQFDGAMNWSDDALLYQFLKVSLVGAQTPEASSLLRTGATSPLPTSITRLNSPSISLDVFGVSEFKDVSEGDGAVFRKKFTYELPNNTKHLDLYAMCYLDTAGINTQLGIRLENMYSRYFGAVTSEVVLTDGQIKRSTTLFLKPDNTVWAGPVHLHDGVYMEGSFHTDRKHSNLRRISVQNYKVTDNRKKNYGSKDQNMRKITPIVGDLMFSFNSNTDLMGMFTMNIKQLALTKTKDGSKLFNLSQKLFSEYLSTIKIDYLDIKRQMVKSAIYRNASSSPKIGSSKVISSSIIANTRDSIPYQLEESDNIQEILMFSSRDVRAFQFVDSSKTAASKGEYLYKVEVRIIDDSYNFMQRKTQDLRDSFNNLKELREIISRNSNYDFKMNKIKDVELLGDQLAGIIEMYYDYLQYFENISNEEKADLIANKLKTFTENNYTLSMHSKFITDFEKIIVLFNRRYKTTDKDNYSGAITDRKSFTPSIINLSKVFPDVINFREMYWSYDCLGIQNNNEFPVLSLDQMNERGRRELIRFFKPVSLGDFVRANSDFDNLDAVTKNALGDLNTPKISYFSPLFLNVNGEQISLQEFSEIDHDKVSRSFMEGSDIKLSMISPSKAYAKKSRKSLDSLRNLRKKNSFSFSRTRGPDSPEAPEQDGESFSLVDSEPYLGSNSSFVNTEDSYTTAVQTDSDSDIEGQFGSYYTFPANHSAWEYDVRVPNNALSQFQKSELYSETALAAAPFQWKALVGSRSDNTKNNILNSDSDPFRNSKTKIATEIIFNCFQVVEVFTGYQRDKNNIDILTAPLFMRIDKLDIDENVSYLCRMSYQSETQLGLRTLEQYKLPVLNRFFFISGAELNNIQRLTSDSSVSFDATSSNEISKNIKFATSNIVTQSRAKNPLRDSRVAPREIQSDNSAPASQTTPNRGRVY